MMSSGIVLSFEFEIELEIFGIRVVDDRSRDIIATPHPPQKRSPVPLTNPQSQRGCSADPQAPQ